ncbi:MAG: Allophanate hydrolase 2 subunit 1 [Rubritepida sp.]|nr:Allophanate hydrolase 2 subunit 1 [Rubritepida sp.]
MQAPKLLPVGDAALSVEFADAYSSEAAAHARSLDRQLAGREGIVECVPTLRSLLIHYDPARLSLRGLTGLLRELPPVEATEADGAEWSLPICYDGEYAPDLAELAQRLGMTSEALVAIHAGGRYNSAMVGGYPGFAYLSGLDPRLAVPRRTTPRLAVPAGSLGVANAFTAVYPATVPGGWHIIGCTPVPLFDPARLDRPALIATGDTVEFRPVSAGEFGSLEASFREGQADPIATCRTP